MSECRLGFVGFGHMAQILCRAAVNARLVPRSQIGFVRRDAHKMRQNEQEFKITSASFEQLIEQSDILFLCTRPSQADEVLKEMARIGVQGKKIVSILAGKKIAYLQKYLGSEAQILRVMPNIACEVGKGMTAIARAPGLSVDFMSQMHLFFKSMGDAIELDEPLMDAACALVGSGPGLVLYLIESMAQAGIKQGIQKKEALRLASQVFLGAAQLASQHSETEELIRRIATPGGTTEAGLSIFAQGEVAGWIGKAIFASVIKSAELSK